MQTRRCDKKFGNLVAAGAGGWICIWSVHPRGKMIAYFNACKRKDSGDFVSTMARDKDDCFLVTGDTHGYIRVWDIAKYCQAEEEGSGKTGKQTDSQRKPSLVRQ